MSSRPNSVSASNRDRSRIDAAERDLRIDLFRGLALWLIFLDHIPANSVSWITIRNYGFSDAAEIFIFISGYTAALVYGRSRRDHGFAIAAARMLRRAWQVYAAYVFLFAVFAAEVIYVASAYDSPIFAQKAQIMIFLQHPDLTLIQAVLFNFKPVNLDVLPVYVLFLLCFAPTLWLLQRAPTLILAASGTLYPCSHLRAGYFGLSGWRVVFQPIGLGFLRASCQPIWATPNIMPSPTDKGILPVSRRTTRKKIVDAKSRSSSFPAHNISHWTINSKRMRSNPGVLDKPRGAIEPRVFQSPPVEGSFGSDRVFTRAIVYCPPA